MPLRLKLPAGLSQDEVVVRKCELVRFQYIIKKAVYSTAISGTGHLDMSDYDNPRDRPHCDWHDLVVRAAGRFNPLLAIRYDFDQAIDLRRTLTLRPLVVKLGGRSVVAGKTHVICNPKKATEYVEAEPVYAEQQYARTRSTAATLVGQFASASDLLGVTDAEVVLSFLKSRTELDPVLEHYWRCEKGLEVDRALQLESAVTYACFPWLYAELPENWLLSNDLTNIFEVRDGNDSFPPVRIAGLFVD